MRLRFYDLCFNNRDSFKEQKFFRMLHSLKIKKHFVSILFFSSSDEPTLERIKNILMVMEQRMELRGSAGELLRSAVTPYIQNLSESHFPCHNDKIVDLWKMIIGKNTIEISLW